MAASTRVIVLACGEVEKRLATRTQSSGTEGVGKLYHTLLTNEIPEQVRFGEFTTTELDMKTYDVFGFVEPEDRRFPTDDDLTTVDAIIVSGSDLSVRYVEEKSGHHEWVSKIKALQMFLRGIIDNHPKIKLIGICFGHQIISFAAGKAVDANPKGWELGPTEIYLTEFGRRVFPNKQSLLLQEIHHDRVLLNYQPGGLGDSGQGGYGDAPSEDVPRKDSPPTRKVVIDTTVKPVEGLERWGESDLTANQGTIKMPKEAERRLESASPVGWLAALEEIQIFTCQGHPEFTKDGMSDLIADYREDLEKGTAGIPTDVANKAAAVNEKRGDELDSHYLRLILWQMLNGARKARISAGRD